MVDPQKRFAEVCHASAVVLDEASVGGWRVPNHNIYPHQWLWDSCFHSIALVALGKFEEAIQELELLFSVQTPEGFVPHMAYHQDPQAARDLWKQALHSDITQPPMYGHALRVIKDALPTNSPLLPRVNTLVAKAELGLEWLLRFRRWFEPLPLAVICHPWETGCDDSLRWTGWMSGGTYDRGAWGDRKRYWAHHCLRFDEHGGAGAVSNADFGVADAGFNALLAFNARELAAAGGSDHLRLVAAEISSALQRLYRADTRTFDSVAVLPDADPLAQDKGGWWDGQRWWRIDDRAQQRARSVTAPTLDGALPALVIADETIVAHVVDAFADPQRFGAQYGPRGAYAATPGYLPDVYWRGPTWPQLSYLCWVIACRASRMDVADAISMATTEAVLLNGFAEFWHPDTAAGGGAAPQTWSTLACAMPLAH
jgi:hypothetical protein